MDYESHRSERIRKAEILDIMASVVKFQLRLEYDKDE